MIGITFFLLAIPTILAQEVIDSNETLALVVSVSSFTNDLDLKRPDAENSCKMTTMALRKNLPIGNIIELCESGKATRSQILVSAKELGEQSKEGDTILFVYYGIGIGADYDEPTLLPSDFSPIVESLEETTLGVDEIETLLRVNSAELIVILDASIDSSIRLVDGDESMELVTSGPTASDVLNALAISPSSSTMIEDSAIFGEVLAKGLRGDADLDQNGEISPFELNRFTIGKIVERTGSPPTVSGDWRNANETIIQVTPKLFVDPTEEPRQWRPIVSPNLRRISMIAGSTLIASSVASFAVASTRQACLKETCYANEDEYNAVLANRNAWLLVSRSTGALGLVGLGGGLILRSEEVHASLTLSW